MTAKARRKSAGQNGIEAMRTVLTQHREVALGLYEHDLRAGQQSSDDGAEDLIDQANNSNIISAVVAHEYFFIL